LFFHLFIYSFIYLQLKNEDGLLLSQRSSKAAQTAERKLILVPLSFVLLRIWGTIRFFIFVESGPNKVPPANDWLLLLQVSKLKTKIRLYYIVYMKVNSDWLKR
jgi:hypothetical protein